MATMPLKTTSTEDYLACLRQHSEDENICIFGSPSLITQKGFSFSKEAPFGFCSEFSVGNNYEAPYVESPNEDLAPFYCCEDFGESCASVCANTMYDGMTVDGGSFRVSGHCGARKRDEPLQKAEEGTLSYWRRTGHPCSSIHFSRRNDLFPSCLF